MHGEDGDGGAPDRTADLAGARHDVRDVGAVGRGVDADGDPDARARRAVAEDAGAEGAAGRAGGLEARALEDDVG